MIRVKNKEMIEAIVKEMPKEYREALKGVDLNNSEAVLRVLDEYPTTRNAFISTLVNKVGKSMIFSKVYNNPLKMLKKGKLEYGDSIEEIFVKMAKMKNFGQHWDDGGTPEADLIRKMIPQVSALYIQKNFDKKFKTTVMDKDLRKAFYAETGLGALVQQIVSSIANAIEYYEFKYTRDTVNRFVTNGEYLKDSPTTEGDTYEIVKSGLGNPVQQGFYCYKVEGTSKEEIGKDMVQKVREVAGDIKFMTDKFNMAKEITFCNPSDLVLITTPSMVSKLDVYVLASAFNVSSTDLNIRIIEVDELPTSILGNTLPTKGAEVWASTPTTSVEAEVLGIVMDKDFLQIWDTYQGAGTFQNVEGEYTNYFASREGIFSICLFSSMVVFYK